MKECLCYENYKALIIEGECDELTLQDKWLSIYSEFITLSHETDVIMTKSLRASIIVLESRIARINLCVNTLATLGSEWIVWENSDEHIELHKTCVDCLKSLGFIYSFDPFDSSYYEDLNMILSLSIDIQIQLELKRNQLEEVELKNSGEKVPPSYFTKMLMSMSQHFKFMINERSIMTAEYCIMKRDYITAINKLNDVNNGRKR